MVSKLAKSKGIIWAPLVFILVVAVACGGAAAPTVAPQAAPTVVSQDSPTAVPEVAPTAVPEAMAQPTDAPAVAMKPEGALNIGQSSLGTLIYHPSIAGNPAIFVLSTVAAEGLVSFNKDREPVGMLVESWSISYDFTTWTYNVRKGFKFHKGY